LVLYIPNFIISEFVCYKRVSLYIEVCRAYAAHALEWLEEQGDTDPALLMLVKKKQDQLFSIMHNLYKTTKIHK